MEGGLNGEQKALGTFIDTYRMMLLLRAPGIGFGVQLRPHVVNRLRPFSRKATVTFCCAPTPGDRQGMEETTPPKHDPDRATGNMMSDAYGEAYATRSDEEGFGGIYGRNENPEYGESQGSEVKEKEKGRNQVDGAAAAKTPTEREAATN